MECRLNIESCAQRFEALRGDNNGKADEGEKKKGYDCWEKECWPDLIYNGIVCKCGSFAVEPDILPRGQKCEFCL